MKRIYNDMIIYFGNPRMNMQTKSLDDKQKTHKIDIF